VALTDHEFSHMTEVFRRVIDPDLCFIAEVGDEPAGFSLALPNINQALAKINGELFPFGALKLFWLKRKIDSVRIVTMKVMKEFRKMGIDSVFYHETYKNALRRGIWRGEMSWILEDNSAVNGVLRNVGFEVYKTYRIYDRKI
jgi:hypothetical protein